MNDLIDIVAPLPPPPAPWPVAWLVAAGVLFALMLAGVLAWRWHRRRARRHALRRLRQIERALKADAIDARQAAFGAAESLRIAYRAQRITPLQVLDTRWQALIAQLDDLRYRDTPTVTDAPNQLLRETRHWIRRAPC